MTSTINLIRIDGTVTTAPTLTYDNLVEFVVADDLAREFLVRLPLSDLGAHVEPGARVTATGAEGWVVPGRSWRDEPSRTIVQAHEVQLGMLLAA
jgi:hypothetical protein